MCLSGSSLWEVVLHILLKVEVGKFIILGKLQKLGKLGISVDDTTIVLVLQVMGLDIVVDFLADSGSSHFSSNGLSKESSKLVTD